MSGDCCDYIRLGWVIQREVHRRTGFERESTRRFIAIGCHVAGPNVNRFRSAVLDKETLLEWLQLATGKGQGSSCRRKIAVDRRTRD